MSEAARSPGATVTGGCLCGAVRYELDGPLGNASYCHCSRCRKFHGAAAGPYTTVRRDRWRVVDGEALLRTYTIAGSSSRTFCTRCGSSLFYAAPGGVGETYVEVAMGTLDAGMGVPPRRHIHVASKAPWHHITDALPQMPEGGTS